MSEDKGAFDFEEAPAEFLQLVRPGVSLRVFYGEGNPSNQLRHIRAIVDSEWVVYRVWYSRRQWWMYGCEHVSSLLATWMAGHLTQARPGARE